MKPKFNLKKQTEATSIRLLKNEANFLFEKIGGKMLL